MNTTVIFKFVVLFQSSYQLKAYFYINMLFERGFLLLLFFRHIDKSSFTHVWFSIKNNDNETIYHYDAFKKAEEQNL